MEGGRPLVARSAAAEIHMSRQLDLGMIVVEHHRVDALGFDFQRAEWTAFGPIDPGEQTMSVNAQSDGAVC